MLGQRESAEDTSGPEETATVQNRMWLDVRKLPGGSLTTCSRHGGACGEVAHWPGEMLGFGQRHRREGSQTVLRRALA